MRCVDHVTTDTIHGGVLTSACAGCASIRFRSAVSGRDPWDAMAALFGGYELVGRVDTIRAPTGEVLAYRSRTEEEAAALRVTPPHRWFEVNQHLWMCHDGELLLLAHSSPAVSQLLGA